MSMDTSGRNTPSAGMGLSIPLATMPEPVPKPQEAPHGLVWGILGGVLAAGVLGAVAYAIARSARKRNPLKKRRRSPYDIEIEQEAPGLFMLFPTSPMGLAWMRWNLKTDEFQRQGNNVVIDDTDLVASVAEVALGYGLRVSLGGRELGLRTARKNPVRTKANDRIRLSSGEVMTLREAIDRGLVVKEETYYYTAKTDLPKRIARYIVREVNGDLFWDIGKTMFMGSFDRERNPASSRKVDFLLVAEQYTNDVRTGGWTLRSDKPMTAGEIAAKVTQWSHRYFLPRGRRLQWSFAGEPGRSYLTASSGEMRFELNVEEFDEGEAIQLQRALNAKRNPSKRSPAKRSMQVQSLLFDRGRYTPRQAKAWARSHGYKYGKVDVTANNIRLRQTDPSQYRLMRTISFGGSGIKAVVGR